MEEQRHQPGLRGASELHLRGAHLSVPLLPAPPAAALATLAAVPSCATRAAIMCVDLPQLGARNELSLAEVHCQNACNKAAACSSCPLVHPCQTARFPCNMLLWVACNQP